MDAYHPLGKTFMIQKLSLYSFLLVTSLVSASEPELNLDGTPYIPPRLAGDSLAIKPLKKANDTDVNSIESMFTNGKIKGLIRYSTQYRDTAYHSLQSSLTPTANKIQQYSAIGGYLGYETASYYNISLGATFYTAQKFGHNPDERIGLGGLNEDGGRANAYAVLGESYIKYKTQNNDIRVGRREMPNYRFVSLSNIRFSPITHQGATYERKVSKNLQLNFAYIDSQKDRNAESFINMIQAARVQKSNIVGSYNPYNYDAGGNYIGSSKAMLMASAVYKKDTFSAEVWDYYISDFVNTLYLYGDYNIVLSPTLTFTTAMQYAKQDNVGSRVAGDIDSWFYGLKFQVASKKGLTLFTSYNQVAYNENSYDGGTIFVRWGTPQMFNSFQVQDSETAGVKSYGAGVQFELGHMGIVPNTVIRFRYALYDMPDTLSDNFAAQDRTEATFDLRYSFTKNDGFGIFTEMQGLSVQFRVAYDDYKTNYDFQSYKNLHGYDFNEVTSDFIDTRLYIDYLF